MIYLAGSCSSEQRTIMQNVADILTELGNKVYCPFNLKIENAWDYSQEDWSQLVFEKDLEMLDKADIVVLISPGRVSTAGTNWEQGYAYAKNKKVIVIQYTNESTSLMTYCGSTIFVNSTLEDLEKDLINALNDHYTKCKCTTILT